MEVTRRSRGVAERLRHERRRHPCGGGHVAHRELEQDVPVGHLERPLVFQVDLPLAQAPLHLAGPRADLRLRERFAHPGEEALVAVARLHRVVGARERGRPKRLVPVRPAVVIRAVVQRELELARDLRREPAFSTCSICLRRMVRGATATRSSRPSRRSPPRRSRCGRATPPGGAWRDPEPVGRRAIRSDARCTPAAARATGPRPTRARTS